MKSNPPNYAFDYFIMRSSTKCQCNWHLIIHKGAHTSQAFCVDFFRPSNIHIQYKKATIAAKAEKQAFKACL